jgi:hypothetical protein
MFLTIYDTEDSSLARLAIPDMLTPAQYFEGVRAPHPEVQATKRLMLAVLEDALRCLQTYAERQNPIHHRMFVEAEFWVLDRRADGPFSFETICATLGIQSNHLRDGIRKWCLQLSSGLSSRRVKRRTVRKSEPMGSLVRRRLGHLIPDAGQRRLSEAPDSSCVPQAADLDKPDSQKSDGPTLPMMQGLENIVE